MEENDLPVGLLLSKVHNFLATELEAFSSQEIREATGVNIETSEEILLSLTGDASKVIRDKNGKWRWASKYQIRNFNQLISLLARSSDGISEKDLYDSYKGVRDDIKKLKKGNAVYELKSGSKVLLFPRDHRLETSISDEVKRYYSRVSIPDAIEVHRYLIEHGLKESDDKAGIKIAQMVSRKRPSARNTRKRAKIKLTNTHMTDSKIDLSKDYNTNKDSAFN